MRGPIEIIDMENVQRCMDINVYGPLRVSRAALPALRESQGRIITIGSIAGYMHIAEGGAYW